MLSFTRTQNAFLFQFNVSINKLANSRNHDNVFLTSVVKFYFLTVEILHQKFSSILWNPEKSLECSGLFKMSSSPATPPQAPYSSFSLEVEPLANSSFFSHGDNESDNNSERYDVDNNDVVEEDSSQDMSDMILERRRRRSSHYQNSSDEEDEEEDEDQTSEYGNNSAVTGVNDEDDEAEEDDNGSIQTNRNDQSDDIRNAASDSPNNPSISSENNSNVNTDPNYMFLTTTNELYAQSSPHLREIGYEQTIWSLSTAKPGNGVEQIRDLSTDTYWQSDGGQPHLLNIQFIQRRPISFVCFYLDYNLDESYTPKKLSVRVGMTFHDLEEIRVVELNEPVGWISIPLWSKLDPLDDAEQEDAYDYELDQDLDPEFFNTNDNERNHVHRLNYQKALKRPVRAHFIQICVVAMHQNGRDTHIRQVKVFGPRRNEELNLFRIRRMNFHQTKILQIDNNTKNSNPTPIESRNNGESGDIGSNDIFTISNDTESKENSYFDKVFSQKFQTIDMTQYNTVR